MAIPLRTDAFGNVWTHSSRVFSVVTPEHYYRVNGEMARERALELLVSQLTPRQVRALQRTGKFCVFAGKGLARRRLWISNDARVYNVHGWFMRYCVLSRDRSVPVEDETLMKKLILEHDPNAFFAMANVGEREWVDRVILIAAGAGGALLTFVGFSMLYRLLT